MATNAEIAETIIETYVNLRRTGETVFVTYGTLADLIGRPGQQFLLGAPLDLVRDKCASRGMPDIASVIISQESLLNGSVAPSGKAQEKHGGWPGLREQQARVLAYNW